MFRTIFTVTAVQVLQAGSVSASDLMRVAAPVVVWFVEIVKLTLSNVRCHTVFLMRKLRAYQDGCEAAGSAVEKPGALSHVWECECPRHIIRALLP